MSAEIEKVTGEKVTLIGGAGGIFEIRCNGEILLAKEKGADFPKPGEAAALFG